VVLNCNNSDLEDKVFELITGLSSISSKSKEINLYKRGQESMKEQLSNSEAMEIQKVQSRIYGWFIKTHQYNSKILLTFLKLSDCNKFSISVSTLEKATGLDGRTFNTNYHQMRTIAEKNHGKVFEETLNGEVSLWKPISKEIEELCNKM